LEADSRYFQLYTGGIIDSADCGTNLDHAVEIVGYGEENGILYWTVRNSWSSQWGESGYVRIARTESTDDVGICGIAMQPSFLLV
jgi:cathepsin L